jgi:hypothetical protein
MSESNRMGGENPMGLTPPMLPPNPTLKLTFDEDIVYNFTGNTIINSYGFGFKPNDISFYSNEQWQKLQWFMNMYQQFRCTKIEMKWVPYFQSPEQVTAWMAYAQNSLSGIGSGQLRSYGELFTKNAEITVIPDNEDLETRPVLDEYWQARSNPRAKSAGVMDPLYITFTPTLMGAHSYQQQSVNQNSSEATINAGGAVYPTLPSYDAPEAVPWMATRAYTTAGGLVSQNTGTVMWGLKMYIYCPNNELVNAQGGYSVGHFSYVYQFEYRNPETRIIIGTSMITETEDNRKNLAALRALKGEKAVLQSHRVKVVLNNEKSKTTQALHENEKTGDVLVGSNKRRVIEEEQPHPTPSSHHTQSAQTARTPLARLGLTRNG